MNNEVTNEVTNKVNKKRIINIIIVIILCIVCFGIGYIISTSKHVEPIEEKEVDKKNSDKEEKPEEAIEEQKEEKEEIIEEKETVEQEEPTKSTIITSDNNMNSIKADIGENEKITENIELNGKTLELTYELDNYNEAWGGTPLFKINNNKIENKSLYGTYC